MNLTVLNLVFGAVIALISAVIGAFMLYYLGERGLRERSLEALKEEIQDNLEVLNVLQSIVKEKKGGLPPLYTDAYIFARSSGLLTNSSKDTRNQLAKIYLEFS
ncbi:MAG: hypothetical protein AOA65_1872 [Candidatus Bathyarchaeota archaeon BA1]|nr:MAG: hypothetical protein AOA65_1872 [Candidatus Bathyarchaeota archaeon BA1]